VQSDSTSGSPASIWPPNHEARVHPPARVPPRWPPGNFTPGVRPHGPRHGRMAGPAVAVTANGRRRRRACGCGARPAVDPRRDRAVPRC